MPDHSPSRSAALKLAQRGYFVVPLKPGTKAAVSNTWTQQRLGPADIPRHFDDHGVGLLLGVEVAPSTYLIAIDVDVNDQLLIDRCRLAFPQAPPAKRGAKGITFIARMDAPMKKRLLRRKTEMNGTVTAIEVLATGQQTAIPPTLHPTGVHYEWDGPSLEDIDPGDLPLFTPTIMSEIEIAVKNEKSPLFLLNDMIWAGDGQGGTIHNSVLTAVASLVAHGWEDDAIWLRIDLATYRAVTAAGDDYSTWNTWEHQVRRMIEDARAKGFQTKTAKKEDIRVTVANWLLTEWKGNGHVYQRDGQLAAYHDGHYRIYSAQEIRHAIATEFREPEGVSMYHADWVAATQTALDKAPQFPKIATRKVCLKNGTYDMDTGALLPWSPDDFLISQLPFEYNAQAQCPTYEAFLQQVFSGDEVPQDDIDLSIACFEEYVSHTLFECLDYHRFLVIKGQPRTGKSTLVSIAKLMHDPRALSAVPVHEFGNERYRTAMVGKLMNVVSEVASMTHAADDFLKSVTAGDEVQVRYLYQEPILTQLPTRLLIACNELFVIRDTSGAIQERMLILSCDNYIPKEQRDVRLPAKLRAEAAGIFNRLVRAWPTLRERGYFVEPSSHIIETQQFTIESNHALQWFLERTCQGALYAADPKAEWPDTLQETENSLLFLDFSEWSKNNGFKLMSSVTWGTKLNQIPGVQLSPRNKWLPGGKTLRVRPLTLTHEQRF